MTYDELRKYRENLPENLTGNLSRRVACRKSRNDGHLRPSESETQVIKCKSRQILVSNCGVGGGRRVMCSTSDTDGLLKRAAEGDTSSVEAIFDRFRDRLERMVEVHFDSRLAPRVDASDVVQDTLMDAHRRLPDYLEKRPVHFYVWLRGIAKERLVDLQRRHIFSQRRSVGREYRTEVGLSDDSVCALAEHFQVSGTSPSQHASRRETAALVRAALEELSEMDREALVLRYLERLSAKEASEALGISENAFTKRHIRAIKRLRQYLED